MLRNVFKNALHALMINCSVVSVALHEKNLLLA
jgi:hypothetical protein